MIHWTYRNQWITYRLAFFERLSDIFKREFRHHPGVYGDGMYLQRSWKRKGQMILVRQNQASCAFLSRTRQASP